MPKERKRELRLRLASAVDEIKILRGLLLEAHDTIQVLRARASALKARTNSVNLKQ